MRGLARVLVVAFSAPESTTGGRRAPAGRFGPFYRTGSTQNDAVSRAQLESGELWGRPNRGSDFPSVDAWVGELPAGRHGIEFWTDVPPSPGSPPDRVRWRGPRAGVSIEGGWAKIRATITKVRWQT